MKLIISTLICLIILSCGNNKPTPEVLWVSGIKVTCNSEVGESQCLLVLKADKLQNDHWEYFYTDIEGFEFEEGYLKKIEVLVTDKEEPMAADASSRHYKMVNVLEQIPDVRNALIGDWQLEFISDELLNESNKIPTLSINLSNMSISGNGGCNMFTGTLEKLSLESIVFGKLLNTLRICEHQDLEDKYLSALRESEAYAITVGKLHLYDTEQNSIAVFKKMEKTKNTIRLNDIWAVVRIDGNPINRMVKVPRLEVNVSDMKILGNDGCNNFFGTLTDLTENSIAISSVGSTRMMCTDIEIPQHFNEALTKIRNFRFDKQLLVFNDKDGNEVLAFIKTD